MSNYTPEKDVYSTANPPPGYPPGTGAPFAAGGYPPQSSTAAFAASPYQQLSYQHTGGMQPMYAAAQPQQQIIVAQPMMMMNTMGGRVHNLGSYASACVCPNCGQNQVTRVTYHSGGHAHLWAVILGVLFGFCCIPYLVDGFKDVRHTCSSCGVPLAIYHRSGNLEVLAHQAPTMAMQPQMTGVIQQPLQPQTTGLVQLQPQYTGAQIQPQYMGAPVQPQYTGTQILSSPAPFAPIGTPAAASGPPVYTTRI
ncbi:LITAF-like zinc ribbon domain-containing protein [Auriculariales sp. MPI-PUGE-AT-0066]|nr:LITAF-like zinc ribbon domain-containing protein [Auriculariales sp. MPI-PUGE-AT-0066]